MAVIELAINFIINTSIQKAPFEVIHIENTQLPVDLLLSRESSIKPNPIVLVAR